MTQVEERLELDPLPTDVNDINSLLQSMLLVLSQHSQSLSVVHHVPQIRLYPPPKSCLFSQALQTQPAYLWHITTITVTMFHWILQVQEKICFEFVSSIAILVFVMSANSHMQKIQDLYRISLCSMKSGK